MASVTITITTAGEAGAQIRGLAAAINKVASTLPDKSATGAATVLTIDNAVGSTAGVQITAGPYAGAQVLC